MKSRSLNFVCAFLVVASIYTTATAQSQETKITPVSLEVSKTQSFQPDYVVELFTSQGCSSCPPTNKLVSQFAQSRDDALVLSYGVTYWDYLGWEDTFGDPAFTQRQRDYGKSLGVTIYTPQIVLNGSAHSPRYSQSDIVSMPLPAKRPKASLTFEKGVLIIEADVNANHDLSVVRYRPGLQEVAVKRGENGGRTLKIENVVTSLLHPNWMGKTLSLKMDAVEGENYAVIFHDAGSAKVVTAAVLK